MSLSARKARVKLKAVTTLRPRPGVLQAEFAE